MVDGVESPRGDKSGGCRGELGVAGNAGLFK